MPQFPHLRIVQKIQGPFKFRGIPRKSKIDPQTLENLSNRSGHGESLINKTENISSNWKQILENRERNNLPTLPDQEKTSLFLQVDVSKFDSDSLSSLGIEIISEENDGFIIGAANVNFTTLRDKIKKFIENNGKRSKNKLAELWNIVEGVQWRIEYILSKELKEKWDRIDDQQFYNVDISIACYLKMSNQPSMGKNDTPESYDEKLNKWLIKKRQHDIELDEIARKRQTELENFINRYDGELLTGFIDYEDSFSCRIRINGIGLKDLVLNYQYLFEVTEAEEMNLPNAENPEIDEINPNLLPPLVDSARVCVIDSGIQENHRLLESAIDNNQSYSYINNDNGTADIASNGGHGTKVAGAILFQSNIPREGDYQLPCYIQNAKVLDLFNNHTILPSYLFPPELMQNIVERFNNSRIFNLSITSSGPCRDTHMSQWAATIDKIMFEKKILFLISAGNISEEHENPFNLGIKNHLRAGRTYPRYLLENSCRIANPSQSCFAITVGSVCINKFDSIDKESFGDFNSPSAFSRTGLGLWGMIKPDVVEYGGDIIREKNENPNFSYHESTSPELVKSTYAGGNGVGRDIGTSFSTPKVTHIAAHLQNIYPTESVTLYRALIIQSARLPGELFKNPQLEHIKHFGYGIPDLIRATENSEKRITLISSGEISAKQGIIYSIKLPEELRLAANDFDIMIEVTLSYFAKPRRTRTETKSYLSTWLHWESSKKEETLTQFHERVLRHANIEGETTENENIVEETETFKWKIREQSNWGINGLRRQDSTIQKSWCFVKSYSLPEEFNIAVVGHKGWEKDLSSKVPFSITVSFEALTGEINLYEMIQVANPIEIEAEVSVQ